MTSRRGAFLVQANPSSLRILGSRLVLYLQFPYRLLVILYHRILLVCFVALLTACASTSKDKPNAEIEATSMQLVAYFDTFTDAEVGDVLWYLAQHMGHILLNADFKKAAIDRIVAALAGDRAKQDRLLKIIGKQKKDIKTNLADLETAIKANLAPKPKGKGKK